MAQSNITIDYIVQHTQQQQGENMKSEWTVKTFSADIHPDSGFYHAAKEKPIGDVFDEPESLALAISTAGTPVNLISLYGGDAVQVIHVAKPLTKFQRANLLACGIYDWEYNSALKTAKQCGWTKTEAISIPKKETGEEGIPLNQYGAKWKPWIVWDALSKCRRRTASIDELHVMLPDMARKNIVNAACKLFYFGLAKRVGLGVYQAGITEPRIKGKYGFGSEKVHAKILALVTIKGSCTVYSAAEYLHLNPANARVHLNHMTNTKKLERTFMPRMKKKPIQTWRLPND